MNKTFELDAYITHEFPLEEVNEVGCATVAQLDTSN